MIRQLIDLVNLLVPSLSVPYLDISEQALSQDIEWIHRAGATYRGDDSVFDGSCQYQKAGYMHSLDSEYLVGVGLKLWKNSTLCGQCLLLRHGNYTHVGIIGDFCPDCSPLQLDLNPHLSAKLNGGKKRNIMNLSIALVPCHWQPQSVRPSIFVYNSSSPWVLYLTILHAKNVAKTVSVNGIKAYHDNFGRWVAEMHQLVYADTYVALIDSAMEIKFYPTL